MIRESKTVALALLTMTAVTALSACVPQAAMPQAAPPPTGVSTPQANGTTEDTKPKESSSSKTTKETSKTSEATATKSADSDAGDPGYCSDRSLKATFETTGDSSGQARSGWIRATNTAGQSCKIDAGHPEVTMKGRSGSPVEATFQNDLPPAPTWIELQPGETATTELRWWMTEPCRYIVWDVTFSASPGGSVVPTTAPDGRGIPTFSVCGGGIVHVGGFVKNG
jgi:hypothetical protein